jgi:uncharacterized membrane protein
MFAEHLSAAACGSRLTNGRAGRFAMSRFVLAYGTSLLVIAVLDALWLGVLARDLYQRELGALLRAQWQWLPAALFYLGYPLGLYGLALTPWPDSLWQAALRGALLGLTAYGAYDLTNLATVNGFGWRIALVDMAWGTAVSGVTAMAAWAVAQPRA